MTTSPPRVAAYLLTLAAVMAVTALTAALLPVLGLASAALLFLLPVLLAAVRAGLGPALAAALTGAAAYNYFLLEPRYTFRIHQLDNLVSVVVLVAVAVVTSRLATRLMAREAEALDRAEASAEASALAVALGDGPPDAALAAGVQLLTTRYGPVMLIDGTAWDEADAALSSLDRSAAAWAIHNGDATGHGTPIMPAADWTFLPMARKAQHDGAVAGVARPADGVTRGEAEIDQLRQLCLLLGQARDRAALDDERRVRERLEARDHLRRTLLAALAHDFRTPLTVIAGQLEQLAVDHPEARDALLAARRLDRMMRDLTAAARIEAGALAPLVQTLDLVDVVSAVCATLPLPAEVELTRSVPADLPFVHGDPVLLQHVLTNLVDNAIRHARYRIGVSAVLEENGVVLYVEDDGPGVPADQRERIFERFQRLEGGDRTDGSGLGLAIVKGFAEAMDMTVGLDTAPLGGARFKLRMPVATEMA